MVPIDPINMNSIKVKQTMEQKEHESTVDDEEINGAYPMKRGHTATFQNRFCHTAEEIENYHKGALPSSKRLQVARHLHDDGCLRCRHIYRVIDMTKQKKSAPEGTLKPMDRSRLLTRLKKRTPRSLATPTPVSVATHVAKGQIWSTSSCPKNMNGQQLETVEGTVPVLIVDAGNKEKKLSNIIQVMPLSLDVGFHQSAGSAGSASEEIEKKEGHQIEGQGQASWDGHLYRLDAPALAEFPCLVEIFNARPMLAGNLAAYQQTISDDAMVTIAALRVRWRSEQGKRDGEMDPERAAWMAREGLLCNYLTRPVDVSLEEKDQPIVFRCVPYKRAADDGMPVRDEITQVLLQNDDAVLALLQREDLLMLRLYTNQPTLPVTVTLDGKAVSMVPTTAKDVQEALVGQVDHLPDRMTISLHLPGEDPFRFLVSLTHGGIGD